MVSFVSETSPRLNAGSPFKGVRKVSKVSAVLNFDYAAAVNRQRIREGKVPDFVAKPRKWGVQIKGTPLVEHKGKWYIEAKVESSKATYYLDGMEVDAAEVEKWLQDRHSGRQAVDDPIILRDYAVENIVSIRMKGNEFVIV